VAAGTALQRRWTNRLFLDLFLRIPDVNGGIAQLVERLVRNEKARGSNPLTSSFLSPLGKTVTDGADQVMHLPVED
jgi:hypothetical protein